MTIKNDKLNKCSFYRLYLHPDFAKIGLNDENRGRNETGMTLHTVELRGVSVSDDVIVDVKWQLGLVCERPEVEKVQDLIDKLS